MIKLKLEKEGQAFLVGMIDLVLRTSGAEKLDECHKMMQQIQDEKKKQK